MFEMNWEAWATLGVIAVMAGVLVRQKAGPDTVMLGGLTLLMTLGVFSDAFPSVGDFVGGFGNEGLITIAVLYVVAEGLARTGAMELATRPLLGMPRSVVGAQGRLLLPVAGLSAFLNNTPIVAMFMPILRGWCRKTGIAPSRLFMPLSFAAILGGSCTLIGTATNLVVHGLVLDAQAAGRLPDFEIGMFSVTAVGVPALVVGVVYMMLFSGKLLPERGTPEEQIGEERTYTIEMMVGANAGGTGVVGMTIVEAGLRSLPGVYLAEIVRGEQKLVAVGPEEVLREGDRLIFVGAVGSVVDLRKVRGLVAAEDQVFHLGDRSLVEAVVSDACPIVNTTVREGRFRSRYDAAVIAVHRDGHHLNQKIGDIELRAGDTLLLEAAGGFLARHRRSRDFFLVSAIEDSKPPRHDRAWIALGLLAVMVGLATFTPMRLVTAALWAGGLMLVSRCCTPGEARGAIDFRVLLTMGAALGIGRAIETTGAATSIAQGIVEALPSDNPRLLLATLYLLAIGFTCVIPPIGVVAMLFPIAVSLAEVGALNFMPFAMTFMMMAAAALATPIGYQTNLMVYGPGGYRFTDYTRFGLPLSLLVMGVTVGVAPVIWPF